MPSQRGPKPRRAASPAPRNPDILDVHKTAALLTVSTDTVYDLFNSGDLPGRKVGRKWLTTRAALMRWIEGSFALEAVERAIESGNREALAKALKTSKVRGKG
jgi:excisionase family DNA binding protein